MDIFQIYFGSIASIVLVVYVFVIGSRTRRALERLERIEIMLRRLSGESRVKDAAVETEKPTPVVAPVYPPQVVEAPAPMPQEISPGSGFLYSRPVQMTDVRTEERFVGAPTQAPAPEVLPNLVRRVLSWFKEDWAMKLGAFFLVLAFIWFAEYAIQENWITQGGRIVLGVVVGSIVLVLGWIDSRKHFAQGSVFLVLGSTIATATIAVSRFMYPDMMAPGVALLLMFFFSFLVSLVAVQYRNKPLAVLAVVASGILPLLLNNASANALALFGYLFVVLFGSILLSWIIDLREVIVIAQMIIVAFSVGAAGVGAHPAEVLPVIYAFSAVTLFAHVFALVRGKGPRGAADVMSGLLNFAILFMWIVEVAQKEWRAALFAAWALVFAAGAYAVRRIAQNRGSLAIYACASGALLAAATIAEFSGSKLAFALTLEAALLTFLSYRVERRLVRSALLATVFAVPFMLGFAVVGAPEWTTGIAHSSFVSLLSLFVFPVGLGVYLFREHARGGEVAQESLPTFELIIGALIAIGSLYGMSFVWLSFHALMREDAAILWSLVVYTLVGLYLYFNGLARNVKAVMISGGILLGFVAARLLLIDVWAMEISGRFVTFLVVGVLFTGSAFATRRLSGHREG